MSLVDQLVASCSDWPIHTIAERQTVEKCLYRRYRKCKEPARTQRGIAGDATKEMVRACVYHSVGIAESRVGIQSGEEVDGDAGSH